METLKNLLPDYAKDLRLNLAAIPRTESLSPQQLWGTALAAALASRSARVIQAVVAEAYPNLSEPVLKAARAAAAIMGMNNVYYRFTHLVSNAEYRQLPARLRMQALADPGVPRLDFELWCLAVSAINGCGACMDAHERELRKHGANATMVQDAVRIAAILNAVALVLDGERALSDGSQLQA